MYVPIVLYELVNTGVPFPVVTLRKIVLVLVSATFLSLIDMLRGGVGVADPKVFVGLFGSNGINQALDDPDGAGE